MGYNNRQQQQQDQTVGSILMEKGCCPKKKPKKCCPKKPACPKPCKKAKKSCKKPKKACSKPKKPCARKCNPGPMTNNGYLNFVRSFREANCGLKPREMIIKAARAWCALPEEKKDHYRRLACKVTTSTRHKKRAVCKKGNCK
ncbi:hypothetical protein KR009_004502 [Drosophila setifemur]|nr:hypothetical protein KR009_004502 [Drosophila setifemur]